MSEAIDIRNSPYVGSMRELIELTGSDELLPVIMTMLILGVNKITLNPNGLPEDVPLKVTYIDDDSFEIEILDTPEEQPTDGEV